MKEIFVARKAFAATLTSSAVAKSVTTKGTPAASGSAYISRRIASAPAERTPTTIRSGRSVSVTACPSRRNSGFQASSAPEPTGARPARASASRAAVPAGTVDFPTIRHGRVSSGASASMQPNSWDRSAPLDPVRCGVPTQQKCTSPKSAASWNDVVKRSRPERTPPDSAAIRAASTSTPSTSKPSSAMHAACVVPRYPVPSTVTRRATALSFFSRGRLLADRPGPGPGSVRRSSVRRNPHGSRVSPGPDDQVGQERKGGDDQPADEDQHGVDGEEQRVHDHVVDALGEAEAEEDERDRHQHLERVEVHHHPQHLKDVAVGDVLQPAQG